MGHQGAFFIWCNLRHKIQVPPDVDGIFNVQMHPGSWSAVLSGSTINTPLVVPLLRDCRGKMDPKHRRLTAQTPIQDRAGPESGRKDQIWKVTGGLTLAGYLKKHEAASKSCNVQSNCAPMFFLCGVSGTWNRKSIASPVDVLALNPGMCVCAPFRFRVQLPLYRIQQGDDGQSSHVAQRSYRRLVKHSGTPECVPAFLNCWPSCYRCADVSTIPVTDPSPCRYASQGLS